DGPAVMLWKSVEETARGLGADGARYRRMVSPFLPKSQGFLRDALAPLGVIPRHPFLLARFGLSALRSVVGLARRRFGGERGPGRSWPAAARPRSFRSSGC